MDKDTDMSDSDEYSEVDSTTTTVSFRSLERTAEESSDNKRENSSAVWKKYFTCLLLGILSVPCYLAARELTKTENSQNLRPTEDDLCKNNGQRIGDGICEDLVNTQECLYDGGDCCLEDKDLVFCQVCQCRQSVELARIKEKFDELDVQVFEFPTHNPYAVTTHSVIIEVDIVESALVCSSICLQEYDNNALIQSWTFTSKKRCECTTRIARTNLGPSLTGDPTLLEPELAYVFIIPAKEETSMTTTTTTARTSAATAATSTSEEDMFFDKTQVTFFEAFTTCMEWGGRPFEPRDPVAAKSIGLLALSHYGVTTFWTGITDIHDEGKFVYLSDWSPLVYTNWDKDEPNNAFLGEHMVEFLYDSTINDKRYNSLSGTVCERDSAYAEAMSAIDGYKEINGQAFFFSKESRSKGWAQIKCQEKGMTLYEPRNQTIFRRIWSEAWLRELSTFWVGISDSLNEAVFVYDSDGEPVEDTFGDIPWREGNPDNFGQGEDAVIVDAHQPTFGDVPESSIFSFVCSGEPATTTTTETSLTLGTSGVSIEIDGQTFWFSNQSLNKTWAQQKCQEEGMMLYEPRNQTTFDWIWVNAWLLALDIFWVGISDSLNEGVFVYDSDGERVENHFGPIPWDEGNPDDYGGGEDAVAVGSHNPLFKDVHESYKYSFVCSPMI